MIDTKHLIPMQAGLRLPDEDIDRMWEFARDHGFFNEESLRKHNPHRTSLIAIARIPEDMSSPLNGLVCAHEGFYHFIRDGLHRCCIAHLSRGYLRDDEYDIEDWEIKDFNEANPGAGWVTPINPLIEVRVPDFHAYKMRVLSMVSTTWPQLVLDYIQEARDKNVYCVPRLDYMSRLDDVAHDLWVYTLQGKYGE